MSVPCMTGGLTERDKETIRRFADWPPKEKDASKNRVESNHNPLPVAPEKEQPLE